MLNMKVLLDLNILEFSGKNKLIYFSNARNMHIFEYK
jgi:hypothetical protein